MRWTKCWAMAEAALQHLANCAMVLLFGVVFDVLIFWGTAEPPVEIVFAPTAAFSVQRLNSRFFYLAACRVEP